MIETNIAPHRRSSSSSQRRSAYWQSPPQPYRKPDPLLTPVFYAVTTSPVAGAASSGA